MAFLGVFVLQLQQVCPHRGLVAGKQQQVLWVTAGGCAALVVLQGWNCHPWMGGG